MIEQLDLLKEYIFSSWPTILTSTIFAISSMLTILWKFGGKFVHLHVKNNYQKELLELKSSLDGKENEINSLRDSILQIRQFRSIKLNEKKIEAISALWDAINELNSLKLPAQIMQVVKIEEASKYIQEDSKEASRLKQFFEITLNSAGVKLLEDEKIEFKGADTINSISKYEIFINPKTWSVFAAYRSVLTFNLTSILFLSKGIGIEYLKKGHVSKLVTEILPHQENGFLKHGDEFALYCVDELEEKLRKELRQDLLGREYDIEEIDALKKLNHIFSPEEAMANSQFPKPPASILKQNSQ